MPDVRWPGGCFADEYHWRKSIGPQRSSTLNPNWGGVTEANTFGTHEFMDFIDQIGAEAYVSVNVGSGTPQEAAEWLEYMTAAAPTTLVKERADAGKHVRLVDMFGALTKVPNYSTADFANQLHPNDAGYQVMAETWYAAIGLLLR